MRILFLDLDGVLRRRTSSGGFWLAAHDDREHYPKGSPVLLVDSAVGLDGAMAAELARRLG